MNAPPDWMKWVRDPKPGWRYVRFWVEVHGVEVECVIGYPRFAISDAFTR